MVTARRPSSVLMAVMAGVVLLSFAVEMFYANPDGGQIASHLFKPQRRILEAERSGSVGPRLGS